MPDTLGPDAGRRPRPRASTRHGSDDERSVCALGRSDETRLADIDEGRADLIALGKIALANPDLVARIRAGAPLNKPDPRTFYGGDARGYTDYPTLDAQRTDSPPA